MKFLYFFTILGILALVSACSQLPEEEKAHFRIAEEDNRIRFKGKGASAGMMLMSSMGPTGIAIGVAIDEGIAKKINAAFESEGENIVGACESGITPELTKRLLNVITEPELVITELTFVNQPGEIDHAVLDMVWHYKSREGVLALRYADTVEDGVRPRYELEALKQNGRLSSEAIQLACRTLALFLGK